MKKVAFSMITAVTFIAIGVTFLSAARAEGVPHAYLAAALVAGSLAMIATAAAVSLRMISSGRPYRGLAISAVASPVVAAATLSIMVPLLGPGESVFSLFERASLPTLFWYQFGVALAIWLAVVLPSMLLVVSKFKR